MSLESERPDEEQGWHENLVISGLEESYYATNNWGDKEAPGIYRTRFIDAMLRIQTGDIKSITLSHNLDPTGQEIVQLTLPVRVPALRNFAVTIQARVQALEKAEPRIRDVLPDPFSQ